MTNKELLKKKDIPVVACQTSILSVAYMRVILSNQAFIVSKLLNMPYDEALKQMNDKVKNQRKEVDKMVTNDFKDISDIPKMN